MKKDVLCFLAAAAVGAVMFLTPGRGQTRIRHFNINIHDSAERCSDLKVDSAGEIAQAAENITLRKSEAPILEIDAIRRGHVRVLGGNQSDYTIEVCKVAVAKNRAEAEQLVRGISISRSAGRLTSNGPTTDDAEWLAYFIVHSPLDASLDIETRNGPIEIRDVSGNIKARAVNGPLAFADCSGTIEAHTTNGPIAFNGGGGEARLTTRNGPIAINLKGEMWNGSKLDAHTDNGPVSLRVPDNFRSGVRVETSGHSPVSCAAGACQNAFTQSSVNQRTIQLNGSSDTVRVSTNNGPVSVGPERPGRRII